MKVVEPLPVGNHLAARIALRKPADYDRCSTKSYRPRVKATVCMPDEAARVLQWHRPPGIMPTHDLRKRIAVRMASPAWHGDAAPSKTDRTAAACHELRSALDDFPKQVHSSEKLAP